MLPKALRLLKRNLQRTLNSNDNRAAIQDGDFIVGLLQAVAKANGCFSLADLQRSVCLFLGIKIGRSAFNERMGTKSLVKHLQSALMALMAMVFTKNPAACALCNKIGVSEIIGIDASLVSLWDGLCEHFKGTFMTSAIKLHFAVNLATGVMHWFSLTPGSTHDSKRFPDIGRGRLYIFDLGYWSFALLNEISDHGAFFLSRIKSSASLTVTEVVHGMGKTIVGHDLLSYQIRRCRQSVIELFATMNVGDKHINLRVIGFWDKKEKKYRWYVTNLTCARDLIYNLYRLRWQVELSFKSLKSILNFHQMPTLNPNTVCALTLVALINYVFATIVRADAVAKTPDAGSEQTAASSILRAAAIFSQGADSILNLARIGRRITSAALKRLFDKLLPLLSEVFDPNFRRRKTSFGKLQEA